MLEIWSGKIFSVSSSQGLFTYFLNSHIVAFLGLPDPFAKISVDGSGQCHSTEIVKNTIDPKWNSHYDLYIGKSDNISISIWNHRKIHKKQGSGFLGCVRITNSRIQTLKDTGCK